MTVRSAQLHAELAVLDDIAYVVAQPVVALPPSSADPLSDEMRVLIGGTLVSRPFDPGNPVDTDFPIYYVTKAGEQYVTKAAAPYVTKVAM